MDQLSKTLPQAICKKDSQNIGFDRSSCYFRPLDRSQASKPLVLKSLGSCYRILSLSHTGQTHDPMVKTACIFVYDTSLYLSQFYFTFPFATLLARCLLLPAPFLPPSNPYIPPAKNTINAPTIVPGASRFPNSHILSNKLTSFRTFNTMVTVSADAAEAKRLTPRMQAYCVRTFMTR